MDSISWYSVTPEGIAYQIAQHMRDCLPLSENGIILDGFCGSGGNVIQLANVFNNVVGMDIDMKKLLCAKHNSQVYQVNPILVHDNFFNLIDTHNSISGIFLSPPWGGPSYVTERAFDLNKMEPYDIKTIFSKARSITKNIAIYLPRNSNIKDILLLSDDNCEIHYLYINHALKALCVYWGAFANQQVPKPQIGNGTDWMIN